MRDRPRVETGLREPLLDLLARSAFLAMGQRHCKGRARARAAEGEELSFTHLPQRLLHHLDVGRADAADDRHEPISDPGLLRRGLDLGCARLPRRLEIGTVVDQHSDALRREPGDLLGSDLAAHQSTIVELADHWLIDLFPASWEEPEPARGLTPESLAPQHRRS